MKVDIYIKPRYGLTFGVHLLNGPLRWKPALFSLPGNDWSFHWLDVVITCQRY